MNFEVLNMLEDEFPKHTFGTNKDGELFVNAKKVSTKFKEANDIDMKIIPSKNDNMKLFEELKTALLDAKLVKYIIEEE